MGCSPSGRHCGPGCRLASPVFTQVIGHSNFGTIRSTTCVYKGEAVLLCGPGVGRTLEGLGWEAALVSLWGLTWPFLGKWVYEVLISSQGLMQIGWCTINCRFNQEVHEGGALPGRPCAAAVTPQTLARLPFGGVCPTQPQGSPAPEQPSLLPQSFSCLLSSHENPRLMAGGLWPCPCPPPLGLTDLPL